MAVPTFSSADPIATIGTQATLIDILRWRSRVQPEDSAFIFLADGEDDERPLTYGELDRRARMIAASLIEAGARGSRALLVYDSGLDYIAALYGCFYAGVIAVPVYPPDPFRVDRTLPRLRSIVNDAGASWLLATEETLDWARPLFRHVPGLDSSLATDLLLRNTAGQPLKTELPEIELAQPALLQYTSGSTGVSRGVTISHANVIANLRSIHAMLDRDDNVAVLWLPAYHDMGLIGGIFQPVFSGRRSVFMSPVSFMQRPARWLLAISRYRGTITAAPNFAYDLCVRKVNAADREGLDLSSLRAVLNGAEMVRPETLDRFVETFAECGFRREAFYPCYGLAEATLMVAGGTMEAGPIVRSFAAESLERNLAQAVHQDAEGRRLVGCGRAVPGQRIVIADPETRQSLNQGQVGEIWVAGQSVGRGYWNRPEESQTAFNAQLANGEGPFLRTGDLGFFDQGELFIAGRRKELIIIQGRNHYPHDIEETVWRSHPLLKSDGGAAFSIEVDGEERLAIVQEVIRPRKADPAALLELIRSQVAEVHGVPPVAVTLIPAGTLPKTSSGKKQRRGCREQFLTGSLPAIGEWRDERVLAGGARPKATAAEPRTETEKKLAAIWSDVLGVTANDVNASFFDLGGQSLLAGQLAARIRDEFASELTLRTLFGHSTIAALAAWLDRGLLDRGDHPCADDSLPPVTRADRSQPLVLSSLQEQLWFLEQLESEPRYNLSASVRLHGPLDIVALEKALSVIVNRHEALRTAFPGSDGNARQVIADRLEVPLAIVDGLSQTSPGGVRFNLAAGPLLAATLTRISEAENRLTIAVHHLICDGWSLAVFLRELADFYTQSVEQTSSPAHTAAGDDIAWQDVIAWQYVDFAAWQRSCLATARLARQLDYWKDRLADVEPLNLITDYQRSSEAAFRGAAVPWSISHATAETLRSLAQREGATLYMVLLAAYQTLLSRYCRQQDVCVGSPVSYRPCREFENSIGYFVNTLALRTDLSGNPTFRELLARVRETVLDALANGDAPLAEVVAAVAPRREAGRAPLFNVAFVFENLPWQSRQAAGLTLGDIEIDHTRIGTYDLGLVLEEQAATLRASFVYNAELFDRATVEQMAGAFDFLLQGIARDADQPVMRLGLVAEQAPQEPHADECLGRQRPLWRSANQELSPKADSLSATEGAAHRWETMLSAVDGAANQECAVTDGTTRLTYKELEERANRLAHYLRDLGVAAEVPVAILLERSSELVIAILAVLKAGGAYVPFDPNEATGRLESMLCDTRPRAIITSEQLSRRLPQHEAEEIILERHQAELAGYPTIAPESEAPPHSLAYIIYTSGSSGHPKGVEVSRAALANLVAAMADEYELTASDRVLQIISPAFDVAAEEMFPALLRGATLVLGPPTVELTGRAILDLCLRERVTVAHVPPQLWQQCLSEWQDGDEAWLKHLRVLVHGGETPSIDSLKQWVRLADHRVRVLHEFGLTETTVTNMVFELPGNFADWPERRRLPIGRPVANTVACVLDEHEQPVPAGAPGELYLGGPVLARGYHRLPDATRERFVELILPSGRTARFCRTGDLARRLPDGNFEFLGRLDGQIKLRGLRIEPGEIERVLSRHPAIGEAAVIVREDPPRANRLVAYVVPSNGHRIEADELRGWLRLSLPDAMLPAVFMPLEKLPLNRSHKLDRDALPAPPREPTSRSYSAPRGETERMLADIWQQVLKVPRVGAHDNFFELGGDSILTIQVVARARESGLRFTPRQLFEHQTVAELAAAEGTALDKSEQGTVTGEVPLTPVQRWFLTDDVIDPHHFNHAVLLRADESLDARHLPRVLERLVEQHDALRLRFTRAATEWRQEHGTKVDAWPFEQFDFSGLAEAERRPALTEAASQAQARLDLERGPLARAVWFDLGGDGKRLLLVIHHLVIDALSWNVLLDDLANVWRQVQAGQTPALPPKTMSYKQWAQRLIEYAHSFELETEVTFWKALADRPAARLPRNMDGENVQAGVQVVNDVWSPAETNELRQQANAAYRTQTNELLLAALGQALTSWAGGQTLIDLEGHGRVGLFADVDLSRTVGWCTTWHPYLPPPADLPDSALLRQTKESLRGVPNQGLGFGVLGYLSPKPAVRGLMAALPQAEVSFNFLGEMDDYLPSTLLTRATEPIGPARSPRARRKHLLEINAYVLDGVLHVEWSYCQNLHHRETIERLAADFRSRLAALVAHCLSPDAGGFTPSDFPLARLNDGELTRLADLLAE